MKLGLLLIGFAIGLTLPFNWWLFIITIIVALISAGWGIIKEMIGSIS